MPQSEHDSRLNQYRSGTLLLAIVLTFSGACAGTSSDPPSLGYTCDGREGWALDEARMTSSDAQVGEALEIAIASAERLVTGKAARPNLPSLLTACGTLRTVARRAGDHAREEAARVCLSEVERISAERPARAANPLILEGLRKAR